MPANIVGEGHTQQQWVSMCLLPGMRSSMTVERRVSTGSNGYSSGPETSPESTPVASRACLLFHPPSGDPLVLELPDLRKPPPGPMSQSEDSVKPEAEKHDVRILPLRSFPASPAATNNVLASVMKLPPAALAIRIQHDEPGRVVKEVDRPEYAVMPDMLQMSPCLRPESSPCADDLGNYAMHISQMELVWHGEFDRLFTQYYPHAWYLVPTFYPPSDRWRVFKDSAKVRFSCQECGHGWTSMKGRVIFWFHLNYTTNSGYVMFKLYGQQCQKCKNGSYEHAMWYPEEVVKETLYCRELNNNTTPSDHQRKYPSSDKCFGPNSKGDGPLWVMTPKDLVIGNVYNRVGQIFYGFVRPPLRIDRRQGKPRNQHNAELCQACKEGLCKEEWSFS